MATFEELKDRVSTIIQDTGLSILFDDFINQGVYEIAGGMQSSLGNWITPPIPMLLEIDTVTTATNTAYINMPNTFHRNLQLVASSNGNLIDISNSFIDFSETYPLLNRSGNISEVIEHGGKLYYQGIPVNSETLTIHFYRKPIAMVNDNDVPDGIPEHLQFDLLTNFAAWKIFNFIEDGLEGESLNTQKYMNLFYTGLRVFELSIPDYTHGIFLR